MKRFATRYRSRILETQRVVSSRGLRASASVVAPSSMRPRGASRSGPLRNALVAACLFLLSGLGLVVLGRPALAHSMTPGETLRAASFRALLPAYEKTPDTIRAGLFSPPPAPEPAASAAAAPVPEPEPTEADAVVWPDRQAPRQAAGAPGWIDAGLSLIGTRYVWGGDRPEIGFDCSGFVRHALAKAGISMPRTAREQFAVTVPIDRKDLAPGDLVFFSTYAPGPSHVGIYLGEGRFLHASSAARKITINDLGDYRQKFIGARRIATT